MACAQGDIGPISVPEPMRLCPDREHGWVIRSLGMLLSCQPQFSIGDNS